MSLVSTREGVCQGPCRDHHLLLDMNPVPRQRGGTEQAELPELAWESERNTKLLTVAGIPFVYVSASDGKVHLLFALLTITVNGLSFSSDSQIAGSVHGCLISDCGECCMRFEHLMFEKC